MVLSAKTRFFNFIRRGFMLPPIEYLLYRMTKGKTPGHFFSKFLPNNYQYALGTVRRVSRDGINYILDLSDFVDHKIFFGLQDPSERILFSLIREDSIVIDIGSNNGHYAMKMASQATSGLVIGFEADPKNYNRCLANLRLNGLPNLTIHDMALGDTKGEGILLRSNPKNQGMNKLLGDHDLGSENEMVSVSIETLDQVGGALDLKSLSIIKIDVEGYEHKVLKGAQGILAKFRPCLFVEIDDNLLRSHGSSSEEVISLIIDSGYSIQIVETNTQIIEAKDCKLSHFDILCLPKESPHSK